MTKRARMRAVAVCGGGTGCSSEALAQAEEVGRLLGAAGSLLVCGGRGGVMERAAFGVQQARSDGGLGRVLAILPGVDAEEANPYCDIVLPTGLGIARNILVVRSAEAVILIGGGAGTLSEAAFAWQLGKPLIALRSSGGWAARLADEAVDDRRPSAVIGVDSAREAVEAALGSPDVA